MGSVPRGPFRLGGGEVDSASGDRAQWHGRFLFLSAVRDLKPAAMDSLAAEPLAAYLTAAAHLGRPAMPNGWDMLAAVADDDDEVGRALVPLREALDRWARRWGLREDWCLFTAFQTVAAWADNPRWRETRTWATAHAGWLATRDVERRFRFEHDGWEPTSDTCQEAEAAIRRAFDRELAAYLDRMDDLAKERGFVRTHEKRITEHYGWLVRVVVGRDSCGEIARELGKNRRTVEQAVNEAAELVGLSVIHPPN